MKLFTSILLLVLSQSALAADFESSSNLSSQSQGISQSQSSNILLGLDLQLLVPNNFSGLSLPQTLTGAHVGISLGEDQVDLTGFYNSNP